MRGEGWHGEQKEDEGDLKCDGPGKDNPEVPLSVCPKGSEGQI